MNLWFRFFWLIVFWRTRSSLKYFDEAETPFRVWPSDLDGNMHMNNGVYLSLMDLGRFDMVFRSGLFRLMNEHGWYPVVASQMIRYRKSLEPFQKFTIRTRLVGWDDRFFYIQQKFMIKDQVAALAIVKGRFLKKSGGGVNPGDIAESSGESRFSPTVPSWILEWAQAEDRGWKENVG